MRARVVSLSCLLLGSFLPSPASARIETRSDPEADFAKYRTFEIVELDLARSPELRQHLVRAVARELETAGFRRVEQDADLVVEIGVQTTPGGGVTGHFYKSVTWGFTLLTADVASSTDGTLAVSLVDRGAERGIWQGIATKTILGNDYRVIRKKIDRGVSRLFRDFPPKHRARP